MPQPGLWLAAFLSGVLASLPLRAQSQAPQTGGLGTSPNDPGSARQALPELPPGPAPHGNIMLPRISPPPEAATPAGGPRVLVQRVRVEGATVLPESVINEVAAPFLGRQLNSADLEELRRRLTLAYVSRGYINSGAILPDQKIEDGTVTYRIVEGHVGSIRVDGTDWLQPDYVRDRLALAAGPPLNVNDVEERVQILLQDPLIQRMNVELVPGAALGDATLDAHVVEAKRYSLYASIANDEPPDVGSIHGQLNGTIRDLTGWGDALVMRYGRTEGINEAGVGWAVPVTAYDTLLAFHWDYDQAPTVSAEFQGLDISSLTQTFGIALSQPVYRTPVQALTLTIGFDHRSEDTFLLGEPFSFTPGVNNGNATASILRFSQDWIDRASDQVVAARSTFSVGLPILEATHTGQKPDCNFFAWLGQAQYVHRLIGQSQIIGRADVQLTTQPLFSFEQLPIGGASTVRGYRENTLIRDNGVILSIEGRIPVFNLPIPQLSTEEHSGDVQLAPFYDFGTGWNKHSPTPRPRDLSSVGLGVRWEVGSALSAQLYYGYALRHIQIVGSHDLQDEGIYFRLTAKAF